VQVLANLLRNAIKFTPRGGRVDVHVSRDGGDAVLSVRDTGIGIPPDARGRVFDRYWHDPTGARARGTGLGLSIAKGIVEAHGGRISLESETGKGTTFRVALPID
jgi:signal transduction histidine kinase